MTEATKVHNSCRQQCLLLDPWLLSIISSVKKDLRQEHLSKDKVFCQKYFSGQNIQKLSVEQLTEGYRSAIQQEEQGEQIAEFLFHRWLLKHTHLYGFFEKELSALTSDFTKLEIIDDEQGLPIKDRAVSQFGAEATYLFSIINGVVFSPALMETLRATALKDQSVHAAAAQSEEESRSWQKQLQDYEEKIARLVDRYEKRLAGWERKYDNDVAALKKQIAHLQKQQQR